MANKLTYKQYKTLVEEQGKAILDALAFAATGDLEVEVEIPEGIEILTDLAIGFSYLIDDVKELLREQRRYQTELEQRVTERTAELEGALSELRAVQRRYVREQWADYAMEDIAVLPEPLDNLWLPALAEAVQTHHVAHATPGANGTAVVLPILYADEPIGALGFGKEEDALWEEEEIVAAQNIVEQLGLALENQRLFDQSQQRARELSILNEMVGELTLLPHEDLILEAIYRYTSRLMDTTNFYVAMHNPERAEITFPLAVENNKRSNWRARPFSNGMSEYIIQTGEGLFIDEGVENWLKANGIESIGMLARSWMGVPLRLGAEVTGVIALQSNRSSFFSKAQFELLGAVANQAIIAVQNARQFQQEQARAQREQRLREIAAKIRSSADIDTIMRTAVQEIGQTLGRQTFVYLDAQSTTQEVA